MVRDDDVPFFVESFGQTTGRVHALRVDLIPALPKKQEQERGVVLRILNDQQSNSASHLASPWYRFVQNQPIQTELRGGGDELIEVHRLAHITIRAQAIT